MSNLFRKKTTAPIVVAIPRGDPVPRLLDQLQSVGFHSDSSVADLRRLIDDDVVLNEVLREEAIEEWYLRHRVLATLHGFVQDWRFSTDEVLEWVEPRLLAAGLSLTWDEDGQEARQVRLELGGTHLTWRFSSVQGLVYGVNELLKRASQDWRFVGLETGGDEYFFVFCALQQAAAIRGSALFKEWSEEDAEAREV